MADLLEAIMIFCWGLSWPFNVYKSYKSRTARGKSIAFEVWIWIGYICGIVRKFVLMSQGGEFNWLFYLALVFYFINISEVTVDMVLYVRNRRLDKEEDERRAREGR